MSWPTRARPLGVDLRTDVDDDQTLDPRGVMAGEVDGHPAPERQGDQRDPVQAERLREGLEVAEQGGVGVVGVGRGIGVAVTALVQRQHAVAGRQQTGFVVPGAGVPRDAVQHDDGRRRRRAPLRVVVTPSLQRDESDRCACLDCNLLRFVGMSTHAGHAHDRATAAARSRPVLALTLALTVRVHAGRAGGRLLDRQPRSPRRRGPHARPTRARSVWRSSRPGSPPARRRRPRPTATTARRSSPRSSTRCCCWSCPARSSSEAWRRWQHAAHRCWPDRWRSWPSAGSA